VRFTSLRPPDDAPTGHRMTEQEADALCKKLCSRIWNENMGRMYDKVVEADRRGNVDDRLYYQLLDFFYCFLPVLPLTPSPSTGASFYADRSRWSQKAPQVIRS
jgi:hypothetical protein